MLDISIHFMFIYFTWKDYIILDVFKQIIPYVHTNFITLSDCIFDSRSTNNTHMTLDNNISYAIMDVDPCIQHVYVVCIDQLIYAESDTPSTPNNIINIAYAYANFEHLISDMKLRTESFIIECTNRRLRGIMRKKIKKINESFTIYLYKPYHYERIRVKRFDLY